jgi:hypothetical protein
MEFVEDGFSFFCSHFQDVENSEELCECLMNKSQTVAVTFSDDVSKLKDFLDGASSARQVLHWQI